jgi:DNA repair exonuclease SbcCD ATPase subunit
MLSKVFRNMERILNNSVKKEFINWVNKLDKQNLSEIDIKLLNIIITNFDSLAPLGTAGGKRAKELSELIIKFKNTISSALEVNNTEQEIDISKIGKLYELEIGPFRGFTSQERFLFDKKFTFLYGPNGSGKSSFFEGLEYALIGDISEAASKRIPLELYIQNIENRKTEVPVIYSVDIKGTRKKIMQNRERYRFSLIEKNRIDNFARISATTPNEQKDRIASLFGLDAFSDFVDGFTDNFQQLSTSTPKADDFSAVNEKIEIKKQRINEIKKDMEQNTIAQNQLIKEVSENDVKDKEQLKIFLTGHDGTSGKINQLLKEQAQEIPENIDISIFDKIPKETNELYLTILSLNTNLNNFLKYSSDINYKELYTAIVAIGQISDDNKKICPACKTPIEQVKVNPFLNAENELTKLQDLTALQDCIQNESRDIEQKIRMLNNLIIETEKYFSVIDCKISLSKLTEIVFIDISSISLWLDKLTKEIIAIQNETDNYLEIKERITEYNEALKCQKNKKNTINNAIQKYVTYNNKLVELNTTEKRLKDEINQINIDIENFTKNNEQILSEIEAEKRQVEENKKYIDSYKKLIITLLKKYRNELPLSFATGLSEKVKEYYNVINEHDSDFEKLTSISLPSIPEEKIKIQFLTNPNDSYDALYVLSEGHIRILGLSILLAKAVIENLEFIIFDDIVNAIDEDHRSGIAELLMNYPDLNNREQIITCHGEIFIKSLESKLGSRKTQKEVTHYRFYPADLNAIRGIRVSPGDSTHYLVQAQCHFEKNELKDTASRCRQAVENITENLWRKIGKQAKGELSVMMRSPDVKPDLSSVVDALIVKLGKIDKNSGLYDHLTKLKGQYMWNLLNKGIHVEENQPEFERIDISNLLELIKSIEEDVNSFKIQTAITQNNKKV